MMLQSTNTASQPTIGPQDSSDCGVLDLIRLVAWVADRGDVRAKPIDPSHVAGPFPSKVTLSEPSVARYGVLSSTLFPVYLCL